MTPELRELLHKQLIRDEGLTLKSYKCPAGFWTNGVGHNLSARNVAPRTITRAEALAWLDDDIDSAEADAVKWLTAKRWTAYSTLRKAGFVNFSFNLGLGSMRKFTNTLEAIGRKDWGAVAERLRASLWAKQVKARSERVVQLICFEKDTY